MSVPLLIPLHFPALLDSILRGYFAVREAALDSAAARPGCLLALPNSPCSQTNILWRPYCIQCAKADAFRNVFPHRHRQLARTDRPHDRRLP